MKKSRKKLFNADFSPETLVEKIRRLKIFRKFGGKSIEISEIILSSDFDCKKTKIKRVFSQSVTMIDR